jgi:hypothetical protein
MLLRGLPFYSCSFGQPQQTPSKTASHPSSSTSNWDCPPFQMRPESTVNASLAFGTPIQLPRQTQRQRQKRRTRSYFQRPSASLAPDIEPRGTTHKQQLANPLLPTSYQQYALLTAFITSRSRRFPRYHHSAVVTCEEESVWCCVASHLILQPRKAES